MSACVPPEGTEDGSYHWIKQPHGKPEPMQWALEHPSLGSTWWSINDDRGIDPERAVELGWRYIGPCLLPEPTP